MGSMLRVLVTFSCLAVAVHGATPQFEDYPAVASPSARNNQVVIPRQELATDKQFDQRIKDAARQGPNFAGRYTIVEWSCGSWCTSFVIVNVDSRRIYWPDFYGVGGCPAADGIDRDLVTYRSNSRLIEINGSPERADPKSQTAISEPCGRHYFLWDGKKLVRR